MLSYLNIAAIVLGLVNFSLQDHDSYYYRRIKMVKEQIQDRGIEDPETLSAMRSVPRHLFVPEDMKEYAYEDRPLLIGNGQTISQPFIVAYMTSMLEPSHKDRILEIGTGSGYQAAVLAEIADTVYTVEIIPELALKAQEVFNKLGYKNILCKKGDGYFGWTEHSPFDAIMVTAAAETIPSSLLEQLVEGGKLIIPIGMKNSAQQIILVTKKKGKFNQESLIPVRFVPFKREF